MFRSYSDHLQGSHMFLDKVTHMDCWEAFYMPVFRQQEILIDEQQVNDTNTLFELAKIPFNTLISN